VWVFTKNNVVVGWQLLFVRPCPVFGLYRKNLAEDLSLIVPGSFVVDATQVDELCFFVHKHTTAAASGKFLNAGQLLLPYFRQLGFDKGARVGRVWLNAVFPGEVVRNPVRQVDQIVVLLEKRSAFSNDVDNWI